MCDKCEYKKWINDIESAIDDPSYDFALDFLCSSLDWIERNEHITEKQKDAVKNIINSI